METWAIATNICGVELCATIRFMLHCLGVNVEHVSLVCGDNKGVIQSCTITDSPVTYCYFLSKNKRGYSVKTRSLDDFADVLTKAVTGKTFWHLYTQVYIGSDQ